MRDANVKIEKIRKLLEDRNKDVLILDSQPSFAWLTGGRGHINSASEKACGQVIVTQSSVCLITNNIEAERLKNEEGCEVFDEIRIYSWDEPSGQTDVFTEMIDREKQQVVHEAEWEKELTNLRSLLTPTELETYRQLGQDAALALETTCRNLKRGQTEWQTASQLAANCLMTGIEPVVNLIAADERVFRYRHPLPTGKSIDKYALVVLGGRRNGLVVSLSRLVHFGKVPEELKLRHEAVAKIDAAFMAHTLPGADLSTVFQIGKQEYANQGFEREWLNHHQGGLTGYRSREVKVTDESEGVVREGQAYAWNPSIAGVKSEDTILVNKSGCEIITRSGDFPEMVIQMNGREIRRPTILER